MHGYDVEAQLFLGLCLVKGIGHRTMMELGGVSEAAHKFSRGDLDPLLEQHTRLPPSQLEGYLLDSGYRLAEKLQSMDVFLVRDSDPEYPTRFRDLEADNRPKWIFCRGNIDLLEAISVAVVGTRAATPVGDFLTKYVVATLADEGVPVVSGLAKGIDELAHEWALLSGVPTISILGTGVLRPYPASNSGLAERIVSGGGLLLSEFMPMAEPSSAHFIMRNRLQAALASAVVAPEWRRASGTAHTIRFAKMLGRPTINVLLRTGYELPDHGVAEEEFIVPAQHDIFVGAIRRSIANQRRPEQRNLFGAV